MGHQLSRPMDGVSRSFGYEPMASVTFTCCALAEGSQRALLVTTRKSLGFLGLRTERNWCSLRAAAAVYGFGASARLEEHLNRFLGLMRPIGSVVFRSRGYV